MSGPGRVPHLLPGSLKPNISQTFTTHALGSHICMRASAFDDLPSLPPFPLPSSPHPPRLPCLPSILPSLPLPLHPSCPTLPPYRLSLPPSLPHYLTSLPSFPPSLHPSLLHFLTSLTTCPLCLPSQHLSFLPSLPPSCPSPLSLSALLPSRHACQLFAFLSRSLSTTKIKLFRTIFILKYVKQVNVGTSQLSRKVCEQGERSKQPV